MPVQNELQNRINNLQISGILNNVQLMESNKTLAQQFEQPLAKLQADIMLVNNIKEISGEEKVTLLQQVLLNHLYSATRNAATKSNSNRMFAGNAFAEHLKTIITETSGGDPKFELYAQNKANKSATPQVFFGNLPDPVFNRAYKTIQEEAKLSDKDITEKKYNDVAFNNTKDRLLLDLIIISNSDKMTPEKKQESLNEKLLAHYWKIKQSAEPSSPLAQALSKILTNTLGGFLPTKISAGSPVPSLEEFKKQIESFNGPRPK